MATQRIKGADVHFSIVRDGVPTRIGLVRNNTITIDLERLEEEYLGGDSMEYDEIYNGTQIEADLHLDGAEFFEFTEAVVARAQRKPGGAIRIDAAVTFLFPSGVVRTIVLVDLKFAELPLESGGRKEYINAKVDGKTSTHKFI
ncbi:MAG: hypothetical protein M0R28_17810 [Pigmentiphaga sp.]|nr:hypothetical protein [Pigmentiphaga sp.]